MLLEPIPERQHSETDNHLHSWSIRACSWEEAGIPRTTAPQCCSNLLNVRCKNYNMCTRIQAFPQYFVEAPLAAITVSSLLSMMLQSWHIFLGTFSHSLMGSFSAHPFSNPSPEMVSQVHHHHPWVGEQHAKRPVVNLAFRLTHTLQLFSFQMYFMFDLLFSQIRCVTIASFASYK